MLKSNRNCLCGGFGFQGGGGSVRRCASLRSLDSRGGCLHMSWDAAGEQQVPFGFPPSASLGASAAKQGRLSPAFGAFRNGRSEEHTSELQSLRHLVCR